MIHAVHQLVPTLEPGAIGAHSLELRRLLREMGLRSEIYASETSADMAEEARSPRWYGRRPGRHRGTVNVYQCAIGSFIGWTALRRPEPLVVNHHNITPPRLFLSWEPGVAHALTWGLGQLRDMADVAVLGIGDSAFNTQQLIDLGFEEAVASPVLFDLSQLERAADPATVAELEREKRDGGADILFVSRVAPHKAQHDLLKAFAVYRRVYDRKARLWVVGAPSSDTYWDALHAFARDAGISEGVRLTGGVPAGALAAHYRTADAFLCLSDHEGFCVPLVEAMHHGVPIVAYAAGAVPETLGDAGVLLERKRPAEVAAALHRVLSDGSVRDTLVAAGRRRLALFDLERSRASMRAVFEKLIARLDEG
ncbi:MAG TPA: glycosyltransferase family 4 protein [Acidimicrobiales bacterium]|nr:glycosyltransferase family 4 protein [Acidimicrobiales bacterium]